MTVQNKKLVRLNHKILNQLNIDKFKSDLRIAKLLLINIYKLAENKKNLNIFDNFCPDYYKNLIEQVELRIKDENNGCEEESTLRDISRNNTLLDIVDDLLNLTYKLISNESLELEHLMKYSEGAHFTNNTKMTHDDIPCDHAVLLKKPLNDIPVTIKFASDSIIESDILQSDDDEYDDPVNRSFEFSNDDIVKGNASLYDISPNNELFEKSDAGIYDYELC